MNLFSGITWFDAMLITIWAGITVLGIRRGLGGVVWVVIALIAWPIITTMSAQTPVLALPLSIVFGLLAGYLPRYLPTTNSQDISFVAAGGFAGLVLGFVLIVAIALGFPIKRGYPSNTLPPFLLNAVAESYVVQKVGDSVFKGSDFSKRYVAPDQLEGAKRK
jgi:LytS/YehU family sensor histidine kinase